MQCSVQFENNYLEDHLLWVYLRSHSAESMEGLRLGSWRMVWCQFGRGGIEAEHEGWALGCWQHAATHTLVLYAACHKSILFSSKLCICLSAFQNWSLITSNLASGPQMSDTIFHQGWTDFHQDSQLGEHSFLLWSQDSSSSFSCYRSTQGWFRHLHTVSLISDIFFFSFKQPNGVII